MKYIMLVLAVCGPLVVLSAQEKTLDRSSLVKDLEAWMAEQSSDRNFLGPLAVMHAGEVIYSGSNGMADFKSNTPLTDSTSFGLASVSKIFTAAAVLVLEQEGKLSLEDPIADYLPMLSAYPDIQIGQMVTHTSGFPYSNFQMREKIGLQESDTLNYARMLSWMADNPLPPKAKPGAEGLYSNAGYMCLGALIERVSGKTYGQFVKEAIFDPLDMRTAHLRSRVDLEAPAGIAIPHLVKGKKQREKPYTYAEAAADLLLNSTAYGSSGIYMSVEDLVKVRNLWHSGKVLNEHHRNRLIELVELPDGTINIWRFGYGLSKIKELDAYVIRMSGFVPGYISFVFYVPDYDICFAACTNYCHMMNKYVTVDAAIDLYQEMTPLLIRAAGE